MKFSLKIVLALASTVLLASCSTSPEPPLANSDDNLDQPVDTFMLPNVQLEVAAEAGTCPATVGL